MVLWRVFEFFTRWRGKALTPQKRSTVVCQASHLFPSTSFFTNRSKLVLNFRLLLPKVKLVNFWVYQLISFCHFWWVTASFHFSTRKISFGKAPSALFWGAFLSLGPISLRVPRDAPGGLCPHPDPKAPCREHSPELPSVLSWRLCADFPNCQRLLIFSGMPPKAPVYFLVGTPESSFSGKRKDPNHQANHFIKSLFKDFTYLSLHPYLYFYIYAYVYWTLPNRTDATLRT